ncbi:MAG: hypothetical protein ACLR2G_01925 [Phascolarctobacterium faecium]
MQPGGRRSCDLTVVASYGKAVVIGGSLDHSERINLQVSRLKQAILDAIWIILPAGVGAA